MIEYIIIVSVKYRCNICGKFEFNYESLYAKKQFEGKGTGGLASNSNYLIVLYLYYYA